MKKLDINITTEAEAREYILRAEQYFSGELTEAIECVFSDGDPKVITLSGPTCSGKTTTAGKLIKRINSAGKRAVVLSIDDFFLDRSDRNNVEGEAPDYDSVAAIDLDFLEEFVRDLLEGKPVRVPHYDFTATRRTHYDDFIPTEDDIYIFEGIQAVYPEVTRLFTCPYKSIFICVRDGVEWGGVELDPNEIRLCRRLVRDYNFRGATAEFTYHLWTTVRQNEENNIFPNSEGQDVYINSLLFYEPFAIAKEALRILRTVPEDSQYRDEAEDLIRQLEVFENDLFRYDMIPEDSMYREFIGQAK